jgi:hypothetical protein
MTTHLSVMTTPRLGGVVIAQFTQGQHFASVMTTRERDDHPGQAPDCLNLRRREADGGPLRGDVASDGRPRRICPDPDGQVALKSRSHELYFTAPELRRGDETGAHLENKRKKVSRCTSAGKPQPKCHRFEQKVAEEAEKLRCARSCLPTPVGFRRQPFDGLAAARRAGN